MIVSRGLENGRKINYPTLNIYEDISYDSGVYACELMLKNKKRRGILSYVTGKKRIEIHVLDFNEDAYNEKVELLSLIKIRDFKKYKTKEEKISQVNSDIEAVRNEI